MFTNIFGYWLRRASMVIVAEEGEQWVVADVFDDLQLAIEEDEQQFAVKEG